MSTDLFATYDLEKLNKFKGFLEEQLKGVEKAIKEKTPEAKPKVVKKEIEEKTLGPTAWPFDKFWKTCVEGFRKDHPYSKDLYKFYIENYVGHEEEFVELVDSWNGIYTIKQFGETFYDYLRDMYNACGAYMWDQYELFLGMGYYQYISYLKIKWCREYGIEHYKKHCTSEDIFDRYYAITDKELRLINNKKLPLPKPNGKFKFYEWFDEDYDGDE